MEIEADRKRAREQLEDPNQASKKGGNSFQTAMAQLATHTHPHMQQPPKQPITSTAVALAALQDVAYAPLASKGLFKGKQQSQNTVDYKGQGKGKYPQQGADGQDKGKGNQQPQQFHSVIIPPAQQPAQQQQPLPATDSKGNTIEQLFTRKGWE